MPTVIRRLLFPFSILYGLAIALRNALFITGLLKVYSPPVKTICVGNLSTGGTGKTPFIELLIQKLSAKWNITSLSRGYGRKSNGFLWVEKNSDPSQTGDEALQIKKRFEAVGVAVCANRTDGIKTILAQRPEIDLILLDDAFQHRYVKANVNILLTTFDKPYFNDFLLPAGDLREFRSGSKRADITVVTKCPDSISPQIKERYVRKIGGNVFFATVYYGDLRDLRTGQVSGNVEFETVIALSGIADSSGFESYLSSKFVKVVPVSLKDHAEYDVQQLEKITSLFRKLSAETPTCVVTTEKDAVKLRSAANLQKDIPFFVLPMEHRMQDEDKFISRLNELIGEAGLHS